MNSSNWKDFHRFTPEFGFDSNICKINNIIKTCLEIITRGTVAVIEVAAVSRIAGFTNDLQGQIQNILIFGKKQYSGPRFMTIYKEPLC